MRETNEIKEIRKDLLELRDKINKKRKSGTVPQSWIDLEIQIHLTLVEALEPTHTRIQKVVYGKGSRELPAPCKKGRKPKRPSKL
jgi:hypothetical protein